MKNVKLMIEIQTYDTAIEEAARFTGWSEESGITFEEYFKQNAGLEIARRLSEAQQNRILRQGEDERLAISKRVEEQTSELIAWTASRTTVKIEDV